MPAIIRGMATKTEGKCSLGGLSRVKTFSDSLSCVLLVAVALLLGLGGCASRAPTSTSAEGATNASMSRLQSCSPGAPPCTAPDALETSCVDGTCRIVQCTPGHCDLDGDFKNGCESRTKGCHVNKE